MRNVWEWVWMILALIAAGFAIVLAFALAVVAALFWPSIAILVVFIAGKAVGVW